MALLRRMAFKPIVVSTPFARITIACMAMGVMSASMFLNSVTANVVSSPVWYRLAIPLYLEPILSRYIMMSSIYLNYFYLACNVIFKAVLK